MENIDQSKFDIYKKSELTPYSQKKILTPVGEKSLYKRSHGITSNVQSGSNEIVFVIPYNWVKLTEVEVINSDALDQVDFFVLNSGDVELNQFAFDLVMSKDFYNRKSSYDADILLGMKIKIVYKTTVEKTIGINLIFDEVLWENH